VLLKDGQDWVLSFGFSDCCRSTLKPSWRDAVDIQMRTNVPHIFAIGGMVGTHAGDMIGEIALAIEMGADAVDIGKTIHPYPTLGESHRDGGGSGTRQLHGLAADAQVKQLWQ
jgi:hypothetical protein